jgi:threonine synthase
VVDGVLARRPPPVPAQGHPVLTDPAVVARVEQLSLGEGSTPEVEVVVGDRVVRAKLEQLSPTGSFKDRGAVWVIAAAVEQGAARIVADSSGNAGAAFAAYAARAGLAATVFVPATAPAAKLAAIARYGAEVRLVDGTRADAAAAAAVEVDASGAFHASHVWHPLFAVGTAGLVDELDPVPEVLVLPVGNGTLVLGAALAARGCEIVGVRAEPGTIADGIDIAAPPRWDELVAVVDRWITVSDAEIITAQHELAAQCLAVEPTGAVAAAAVAPVDRDADVVIPLSGAAK